MTNTAPKHCMDNNISDSEPVWSSHYLFTTLQMESLWSILLTYIKCPLNNYLRFQNILFWDEEDIEISSVCSTGK
jgi:hypothetical protein